MIGGIFRFSMSVGGVLEFSNYLYVFDNGLIGDAPKLPDNKNDQMACRNLILQSRPHDLRDYLLPLTGGTNQSPITATPSR